MPSLPAGTPIGGDYEVVQRVETLADPQNLSSMYEGRHRASGERVYIRLCDGQGARGPDAELRARFVQEARALSGLSHPGLLEVLDFGLIGAGAVPYMVQRYAPGSTLSEVLVDRGRVPPERALRLMTGLLDVLATAHERGVINRSVEPANLLWSDLGEVGERLRPLTFGAVFLDDHAIERMTRTGELIGAARYLAPEYIEEGLITPSLDVYQAGLVLVEMLTGRPVVRADDPAGCIMAHTRGMLDIPQAIRRSRLWGVLAPALSMDWQQRYANAGVFRDRVMSMLPGARHTPSRPQPAVPLSSGAVRALSRERSAHLEVKRPLKAPGSSSGVVRTPTTPSGPMKAIPTPKGGALALASTAPKSEALFAVSSGQAPVKLATSGGGSTASDGAHQAPPSSSSGFPILDGRFEVLDKLGAGGFGEVMRGRHVRTHMPVAIKLMTQRPDPEMHASFKRRFEREARAAACVAHPSIVTVHHYGVFEDRPYIVMELLQGHDLEHEVDYKGPMEPERLLPIFCDVLDALGEAHRQSIVHKDLKPANLFLCHPKEPWEMLKILDFGIARMGQGEEAKLTVNGRMLFTPNYVAPEYITGQIALPQTDVYQMGLILAELLVGYPLVQGEQIECVMAHMHGKFDVPDVLLNSSLWSVLSKATALEYVDRYADGGEFSDALRTVDVAAVSQELASLRAGSAARSDAASPAQGLPEGSASEQAAHEHGQGASREPHGEGSELDTVVGAAFNPEVVKRLRQLEHLHEQEPHQLSQIQSLLDFCLTHGNWSSDSAELVFFEEVIQGLLARAGQQGDAEALSRSRQLMQRVMQLAF